MRRLTILAVLAVAAVAAPGAAAKPGHEALVASIDVAPPTEALRAGEPWTTAVTIDSAHPRAAARAMAASGGDVLVTLVNQDLRISRIITAAPTADPLGFRARIEFPAAGVWAIGANALQTDAAVMTVWVAPADGDEAATAAVAAGGGGDGGSMPWAALAAAAATSLAIGGGLLALRRRRPQPI